MTNKQSPSIPCTSDGNDRDRKLLLIDDLADMLKDLFDELIPYGYETIIDPDPDNALKSIHTHKPDVLLLDLHFPGDDLDAGGETSGARLLGLIQREFPRLPVVIFTDKMTDDRLSTDSINLQRYYAKDNIEQFIDKGMNWAADLAATLELAIEDMKLQEKSPEELDAEMGFVIGKTPFMQTVVETIRSVAGSALTVLLEGETGTGKELVAKAIHQLSGRETFTAVNCSGIHEETLEDKLFGHEKGAYTDAKGMRKGLFESAQGGTVFLDEIQAMPLSLQNKLIRVVQDKMIQRMGSSENISVDVRIIVATNRPAKELVYEGKLREDLYFRLSALTITLPPLRQRMEDIPLLWPVLVEKANRMAKKSVMTNLRKEVRGLLEQHTWPGNVRELENVISRAVVNSRGNIILPQDIVFEPESPCPHKETISTAAVNPSPIQPSPEIKEQISCQETSENMDRLNKLPVEQRWEFFMKNTAGDTRKAILIEIIRSLKVGHPYKKVTHKKITEVLCGNCESQEEFKKNYDKVRTMMSKLQLYPSSVD